MYSYMVGATGHYKLSMNFFFITSGSGDVFIHGRCHGA